jgi:hypothetical protein
MKIGPFIVAAVLLGASPIPASFAEDAAPSGDHRHGSNLSTGPSGPRSPRNVKPGSMISAPGSTHARRLPTPPKPPERNAIGQPVAAHDGIRSRNEDGHALQVHVPAGALPAAAAAAAGSTEAKTELERPAIARPIPGPIVSAPIVQRGTITGTGLVRPNSAPSSVGGPAKVAGGINGTSMRPRH